MERVAIIGSGNWGSAIAKVIGQTVQLHPTLFHNTVNMWVYEETLPDGRLLSQVINETGENVKYLPGHRIPKTVVAVTDLRAAVADATILVFVLPHQFIHRVCHTIKGHLVVGGCRAVSLIKGVDADSDCGLKRVSMVIKEELSVDQVAVLMGANIADEVAKEQFCEATVGCADAQFADKLRLLFELPHFRIQCSPDVATVELCGALKNVVAVAAGIIDGLRMGANTKAAVIRIGLLEMRLVIGMITGSTKGSGGCDETMFESCGVADLITTCFGGRNRRIGQAVAEQHESDPVCIDKLEAMLLGGQKVQGPPVAREVAKMARCMDMQGKVQLFMAVNAICYEGAPARHLIDVLQGYQYHA